MVVWKKKRKELVKTTGLSSLQNDVLSFRTQCECPGEVPYSKTVFINNFEIQQAGCSRLKRPRSYVHILLTIIFFIYENISVKRI